MVLSRPARVSATMAMLAIWGGEEGVAADDNGKGAGVALVGFKKDHISL